MTKLYHFKSGEKVYGPYSIEQLRKLVDSSQINLATPVREQGKLIWQSAESVLAPTSDDTKDGEVDAVLSEIAKVRPISSSGVGTGMDHSSDPAKPIVTSNEFRAEVSIGHPKVNSSQNPHLSNTKKARDVDSMHDLSEPSSLKIISGLLQAVGGLILVVGVMAALGMSQSRNENFGMVAIAVVVGSASHALVFFMLAAVLDCLSAGLVELRRIAELNTRIEDHLSRK